MGACRCNGSANTHFSGRRANKPGSGPKRSKLARPCPGGTFCYHAVASSVDGVDRGGAVWRIGCC